MNKMVAGPVARGGPNRPPRPCRPPWEALRGLSDFANVNCINRDVAHFNRRFTPTGVRNGCSGYTTSHLPARCGYRRQSSQTKTMNQTVTFLVAGGASRPPRPCRPPWEALRALARWRQSRQSRFRQRQLALHANGGPEWLFRLRYISSSRALRLPATEPTNYNHESNGNRSSCRGGLNRPPAPPPALQTAVGTASRFGLSESIASFAISPKSIGASRAPTGSGMVVPVALHLAFPRAERAGAAATGGTIHKKQISIN